MPNVKLEPEPEPWRSRAPWSKNVHNHLSGQSPPEGDNGHPLPCPACADDHDYVEELISELQRDSE